MKNQNASAEYPHIPAKGQLADCPADGGSPFPAALAVAAEHGKPLCGWEEFFFSNCSVSSAGRRRGFPLHP